MGFHMDEFDQYMVDLANFRPIWCEWSCSKPSFFKHPIKYIKWYFSEPDFDEWIKEKKR